MKQLFGYFSHEIILLIGYSCVILVLHLGHVVENAAKFTEL